MCEVHRIKTIACFTELAWDNLIGLLLYNSWEVTALNRNVGQKSSWILKTQDWKSP